MLESDSSAFARHTSEGISVVDAEEFIDGASINWRRLGQFSIGALLSAVFAAWTELVFAIGDLTLSFPEFLGAFLSRLVTLWANLGFAAVRGSWSEASSAISEAGAFALVASIALVFLSQWIILQGVQRLG